MLDITWHGEEKIHPVSIRADDVYEEAEAYALLLGFALLLLEKHDPTLESFKVIFPEIEEPAKRFANIRRLVDATIAQAEREVLGKRSLDVVD
jgi:hypothetical protein